MMNNLWPDLFIVGAAKTGTSSLYQYLIQHPDVARAVIKEPHFFSSDINPSNFSKEFSYHKVPNIDIAIKRGNIIHSSFIRSETDYLKLYAHAGGKLKIDSSVSNLYSSEAAKNIYNKNPDARIIIIIRQPVERAFSHYVMDLRSGYKLSHSFVEAVRNDYAASNKGWGISHLYVELSLYADSIKRYFNVFPKNQILIIMYDDYRNHANEVLKKVSDFAGLSPFKYNTEKSHNTAALPRFFLTRWLNRNKDLKRSISSYIPENIRFRLRQIAYHKKNMPALSEQDYKELMPLFVDDIHQTEELTGLSLQQWIKP
jgi:hypothetical protein